MNRIKNIWCIKNFNHELMLEIQQLNKILYSNLYQCNNTMTISSRNSVLKNEINTIFQNTLFDFLYEEQELYDYYDNKFQNHNYYPRNQNLPFKSFITYYKNLYLDLNSNKNKTDMFKKIRWYIFSQTPKNFGFAKNLFKSSIMMMDIDDNNDDNINNDLFNDNNYNIYNCNSINNELKESDIDNIKESDEIIINNDFIDNLILNEDNPLLYILKLLYLSISSFCKENICYLLTTYSNDNDNDNSSLINNYLKRFNNFVECGKIINTQCENINISTNYLYNELFNDYPKIPKFSIFRLFVKIWYKESTSFLIQNNNITLLNKIKHSLINIYANIIEGDMISIKNDSFISNSNILENNNQFFNKKGKVSLSSSISIFNSDNILSNNDMNSFNFIPFGSLYDDNNSKYYIIEKGLNIIYDSFCNEFNVNLLNLSNTDANNYYNDIENSIIDIISESIKKCFERNVIEKDISLKIIIKHILSLFKDYFYENRIISKLKKTIFNIVYKSLQKNIFNYIIYKFKLKYKNDNTLNNNNFNYNFSFNEESVNTNYSSYFESKSSLNNFINFDGISNYEDFINETTDYIIKQIKYNDTNTSIADLNNMNIIIKNYIEDLNKKEKLAELFKDINEWNNTNINNFDKINKKVNKELSKKLLSNKYDPLQMKLFSYSIESDWEFIEKVKSIENKNNNDNNNIKTKYKNEFNNKSSIYDTFTDYQSLNDFNNLNPFYNESNTNTINNNNNNKYGDDIDIDINKNVFNLDLKNNFFGDISKNDDDINPFKMEDEKANNNLNNNYFDFNNNWNNNNNENKPLFGNYNNYDLSDLNP